MHRSFPRFPMSDLRICFFPTLWSSFVCALWHDVGATYRFRNYDEKGFVPFSTPTSRPSGLQFLLELCGLTF
uniref:Putative secreted protein n=1 Tax=Anopheles marajoara TaxID=58244 RepID=A0A2M4CED8_9DIPT